MPGFPQTFEPKDLLQGNYFHLRTIIPEKYKYDDALQCWLQSHPEDIDHQQKMTEYYLAFIDFKKALLDPEKNQAFNKLSGQIEKEEYVRQEKLIGEIIASKNILFYIKNNTQIIEHKKTDLRIASFIYMLTFYVALSTVVLLIIETHPEIENSMIRFTPSDYVIIPLCIILIGFIIYAYFATIPIMKSDRNIYDRSEIKRNINEYP